MGMKHGLLEEQKKDDWKQQKSDFYSMYQVILYWIRKGVRRQGHN
jgi:hypothetical protein